MPLLDQGADGIDRLTAEAAKLGIVLDNADARKVAEAKDAIDRMKGLLEGVGRTLAVAVAPYITALSKELVGAATEGNNLSNIVGTGLKWAGSIIGFVVNTVQILKMGWQSLQVSVDTQLLMWVEGLRAVVGGVEWLINAARELAGMKPMQGWGKDLDYLAQGMRQTLKEDFQELRKQVDAPWYSTEVDAWSKRVQSEAAKAAESLDKGPAAAMERISDAALEAQESASKLLDKLQADIKYFGLADKQRQIAELRDKGATEAQIQQLQEATAQLEGMEAAKKALDDAQKAAADQEKADFDAAARVVEDLKTPLDKFNDRMTELQRLADKGLIDADTFAQAQAKAEHELQGNGLGAVETKFSAAARAGSTDAYSAIVAHRMQSFKPSDPQEKIADLNKQQLDQMVWTNRYLRDLIKATPSVAEFAGL